jgi:hypothetical protein
MLRLATRLAAGGGRESLARTALTAAGLALAVALLLVAAVAFPALEAHDVRGAWRHTSEDPVVPAQDGSTTDPLLWRLTQDRYDGRDLVRVDLAAEGPDAPVPPGLDALPGPGEVAVSPALRDLIAGTEPAVLGDRFPGEVTATVGRDALISPDDLVAFVGHSPEDMRAAAERDTVDGGAIEGDLLTVRSIEASPVSRNLTREMRVVFVVGGLGLLIPVVVFVATATRLAAARRERRLAALRLAGATDRQVGVVAAVEAAVAAVAGTVAGFGLFLAVRPALADIPFDGATFYPSDLHLSLGWAATVALGVPALAIVAAIVSLRRLRISPLGVARRAERARPRPWPLGLVGLGLVALLAIMRWLVRSSASDIGIALAIGAAFVTMIVGIALSGPWLTAMVARGVGRFGRRAPSLLAARRLEDNPAAGFRAISGLVLAVFVGTVFSGMASTMLADEHLQASSLGAHVVAAAPDSEPPEMAGGPDGPDGPGGPDGPDEAGGPDGAGGPGDAGGPDRAPAPGPAGVPRWQEVADADALAADLAASPGVLEAVAVHAVPQDPAVTDPLIRSDAGLMTPVLVTCDGAEALGFDGCEGTTFLDVTPSDVEQTGVTAPLTPGELAELPVVSMAAVTDGEVASIERARTVLGAALPGTPVVTGTDLDAETQEAFRTMQRVSNIALAVTLVIAGCSLAVAVAGTIVERRQPFALLRLAGTGLSDLRRIVLAEAAAPLLMVATASAALGLAVAAVVLSTTGGGSRPFVLPGAGYWLSLAGGLAAALVVVLATLPLLDRLTSLDSARFE